MKLLNNYRRKNRIIKKLMEDNRKLVDENDWQNRHNEMSKLKRQVEELKKDLLREKPECYKPFIDNEERLQKVISYKDEEHRADREYVNRLSNENQQLLLLKSEYFNLLTNLKLNSRHKS